MKVVFIFGSFIAIFNWLIIIVIVAAFLVTIMNPDDDWEAEKAYR